MKLNQVYCIDALKGLKSLKDASVNLVISSPPYSDVRKSYPGPSPFDYVKWFTPIAKEILRVLSDDGSFILNINDKCVKGERIPYAFELVIKLRELGFCLIDSLIWVKKNGITGSVNAKRGFDAFEYIFHFGKTTKIYWNPDEIRRPNAQSSIKRAEKPIKVNASNREARSGKKNKYRKWKLNDKGAFPTNVVYFKKDSGKDHIAAFDISLPMYFIKSCSKPGDVVLDPFCGRGTTCKAVVEINKNKKSPRKYIGFDICQEHINLAKNKYLL